MPFGLLNSLAVFQALVNDTLRDMLNRFLFVYLLQDPSGAHPARPELPPAESTIYQIVSYIYPKFLYWATSLLLASKWTQ